nr:PREDICTED: serine/threonine-protein phosphatase 7 long form homolog [Daucus carota subsp. sativus]
MDPAAYHPGPVNGYLLTLQDSHSTSFVWNSSEELPDLRVRTNFGEYWNAVHENRPPQAIMDAINDAGFEWVFKLGQVKHDRGLITAFIERWRPETHTFHLPFGKATITLEDVHHILGLRTTGRPFILHGFTTTARQRKDMIRDLLGLTPEQGDVRKNCLRIGWLISNFGNCARLDSSAEDFDAQTIFHIRAHLLCVIGSLFPDSSGNYVNLNLLWILRDLQSVDDVRFHP